MELILKRLKAVQPNKEFHEHSRALILNAAQIEAVPPAYLTLANIFNYKNAAVFASLAIVLLASGLSLLYNAPAPSLADSLDNQKLTEEAQTLDIQIQLSQVRYYQDSAQKIEVALNEASDEYAASEAHQKELDELLNELTL